MRKFFTILLIFVSYLYSQQFTLEWINPKPTGANLLDVEVIAPNKVSIYGIAGTNIKSNDGLNTYNLEFLDENRNDIWAVHFLNEYVGYLCGENGLIMKTTNGGLNWVAQNSWVTSRLYDIKFLNPDSGFAVGASGLVLKTTDGGNNWITSYYQTSTIYTIEIISKDLVLIGSAYSGGQLAKSTDFGNSWTAVTSSALSSSVYSIFFLNETTGWLGTASNGILFTNDGGQTWLQQMPLSNIIYDIKFKNSQVGFASDSKGYIFITVDGGLNWIPYLTPSKRALRAIAVDGDNVYVVGDAGSIYRSTNNGNTWEEKFSYIGQALEFQRRVIFLNENIGFICGGSSSSADSLGYVLKTTDGGETWTQLPYNFKTQLYAISAPSENVIYASAGSSLVFKSTDGGLTWTKSTIYTTSTTLWDIQFYDENLGYACGASGRIFKTTNGGANWTLLTSPFGTSTVYTMSILDASTVVAVGVSAKAYKTTDGGSTWTALSVGIPGSYFIVRFYQNVGYIGSYLSPAGYVSKSTDGGNTWTPLTTYPGTQSVWGIAVKDTSTVYVTDLYGYVYYSNDGGNSWVSVPRIFGTNSFYCSMAGDKLFISGSNGAIIKGYLPTIPQETRTVAYSSGWNMLSVPLVSSDMRKTSLFPDAVSSAFAYDEGYYIEDTLKTGKGYWLKFNDAGSVNVIGLKVQNYSIQLPAGWNLFGPFDFDVPISNVSTNPPDILASAFFKYDKGYKTTEVLEVGKGYWIKLSQPGTLTFSTVLNKKQNLTQNLLADALKISISDYAGNSSNLYLVQNQKLTSLELPPKPPAGIFDVRFENNKLNELFDNDFKTIEINSASYPVVIKVEGFNAQIMDCINGEMINQILKAGDKLVINDRNITHLKIKPTNIVYDFALYQNYPNPFNPVTTIKFSIPEASNVKLSLYDVLGRKVKILVDEKLNAGIYTFNFDGSELASGIYIYRLEAGKNVSIKKMMLLK
ncbi:MAG: YCF48-related protein [Ignavibacteria bacterium]